MMFRRNPRRPAVILGLTFLFTSVSFTFAAEKTWPTSRITVPGSLDELKSLETAVKNVIAKTTPYTVGLLVRENGKTAAGSGVIVSADGLVLTAGHVSGEPGRTCTIILSDGKRVKGKTLGHNDRYDSGMIQITDRGPKDGKWPHADVAKSGELKDGQWMITLGHPGGYHEDRPPVARLGRVLDRDERSIRTNCTIVGGDSGGPLFDLNGKLVGIHSRIGESLAQNIHVPTDAFTKEWDKLVASEVIDPRRIRMPTAMLGVQFDESGFAPKIAKVNDDTPASRAGVKEGDIIAKFDGRAVDAIEEVRRIIARKKPGDEVPIEVTRGGKTVTLKAKLVAIPKEKSS